MSSNRKEAFRMSTMTYWQRNSREARLWVTDAIIPLAIPIIIGSLVIPKACIWAKKTFNFKVELSIKDKEPS